ncbi:predicted protein [Uncinocarpus reesii 1704]|uniref:Uncharacterized protein n=1 Tax=Uncinocarpus reesii (strain UAMH 1704) TaxID=336963 RepID=C4K0A7_UNCRE|nr:uncharacterized protein UREG_07921 [Uncinocarpus reesii 1704]EEP83056.1 predicted protein [Uncinocarpus reesii 1704]
MKIADCGQRPIGDSQRKPNRRQRGKPTEPTIHAWIQKKLQVTESDMSAAGTAKLVSQREEGATNSGKQ